jgi:selenocysteine-specific elongation factor
MTSEMLAGKCLCRAAEMDRMLEELGAAGEAASLADGRWIHRSTLDQFCTRLLELVSHFHQTQPQHEGLAQSVAKSTLTSDGGLFESALTILARDNRLRVRDGLLSEPGWRARLAPEEERQCDQVVSVLKTAGWIAPTLADLAGQLGLPLTRIQTLARLLTERGLLVHLGEERYIHHDSVDAAQRVALDLFARASSFSTMDFRDALGVSRKYAVPLLDYLDSIRFTARSGNQRSPGVEARRRM